MARVGGINIPDNKHVDVSLTHIYGIGRKTAQKICDKLNIKYSKKVSELSEDQLDKIRDELKEMKIEGDLRRDVNFNIKRCFYVRYAVSNNPFCFLFSCHYALIGFLGPFLVLAFVFVL